VGPALRAPDFLTEKSKGGAEKRYDVIAQRGQMEGGIVSTRGAALTGMGGGGGGAIQNKEFTWECVGEKTGQYLLSG